MWKGPYRREWNRGEREGIEQISFRRCKRVHWTEKLLRSNEPAGIRAPRLAILDKKSEGDAADIYRRNSRA